MFNGLTPSSQNGLLGPMFIRRVKTRTTQDGTCYYSHRLVDSYRVGDRVRQRTLLNLGNAFTFPRDQWPELAQRIEQLVAGQHDLLACASEELERQAQSIAGLLLRKYSGSELLGTDDAADGKPRDDGRDLHTVDLNSVEHIDSRTVGAEALALHAVFEAQLPGCLESLGFNRNQLHAAIGNIVGRMIQPNSELSTHDWLQRQSALGELLDFKYEKQGLSALYRASDLLWKHHEKIEGFVYQLSTAHWP